MKIVTVIGARPQFIKAAVVSRCLAEQGQLQEILVHTGQHYDARMSDIFFKELGIPNPHYNLGVGSGSHGVQTGRMLERIEEVLMVEEPDWVLLYGDTNSTLAGALAASKLHIPVAHVEAGLRSFNRRMPEEINRVLTDHTSDLLFAPTAVAMRNLHSEGISGSNVVLVGDVMYDAALWYGQEADQVSTILEHLGVGSGRYVLATVHRAENTDHPERIRAIFAGLAAMAERVPVVVPVHPRTRPLLAKFQGSPTTGLKLIDPVGYLDMVKLEKNAKAIVTDSGGVQKEAFFHKVPCVTLRPETEWIELVELGWNTLVPELTIHNITSAISDALLSPGGADATPYGSGHAGWEIAQRLVGGRK